MQNRFNMSETNFRLIETVDTCIAYGKLINFNARGSDYQKINYTKFSNWNTLGIEAWTSPVAPFSFRRALTTRNEIDISAVAIAQTV